MSVFSLTDPKISFRKTVAWCCCLVPAACLVVGPVAWIPNLDSFCRSGACRPVATLTPRFNIPLSYSSVLVLPIANTRVFAIRPGPRYD